MPRNREPTTIGTRSGASGRPPGVNVWTIRHEETDLHGIGDLTILKRPSLGLICSVQCPGSVVIKTLDAIRELRDAGVTIAGGFHSPMEKECLEFLLRGKQSVIVCPAKGLSRPRIPAAWRPALDAGRLLIVSRFLPVAKRTTKSNAQARNEFVAALSTTLLVPYATPGGNAEALVRLAIERGQTVLTFEDHANDALIRQGARGFSIADLSRI